MNIDGIGNKIDDIEVVITSRIIELFSAGLYSSPNKAFEELICNSYDAFASKVAVFLSDDLNATNAYIWVCDNGEGMNAEELKKLWIIGKSEKRSNDSRDKKRLQIGRFGIGKLSTYILARKLTYISKKNNRFYFAVMDYDLINNENEKITIDEREASEQEIQGFVEQYACSDDLSFQLFGKRSEKTWTFCLMTDLKAKASEIQIGRLKWLLSTALPLNPEFSLLLNRSVIQSSKEDAVVSRKWIIGDDDDITIDDMKDAERGICVTEKNTNVPCVDFRNLTGVYGEFVLYETSLVGGKSTDLGRSHGIFLIIRGRLINIDDPLLGMDAFSHGAFNRTRIIIHADRLDDNLASTRESIMESLPLRQLKTYIKKKFNNEVRKYYFDNERKNLEEKSISKRVARMSFPMVRRPLMSYINRYFDGKVQRPYLIEITEESSREELLKHYDIDLETDEQAIEKVIHQYGRIEDPIAKFYLNERKLVINDSHPFVADYADGHNDEIPLENIIIAEVLSEAYLYELLSSEEEIHSILLNRDELLRQLTFYRKKVFRQRL